MKKNKHPKKGLPAKVRLGEPFQGMPPCSGKKPTLVGFANPDIFAHLNMLGVFGSGVKPVAN
ncbi:hypothetical protein EPN28_04855 [Patescibacteria group bacterium]|nr:MAG: hypothetical protein EPN28_04855 [Patescibacteria group bacterium]